jgi:hypothetical protein
MSVRLQVARVALAAALAVAIGWTSRVSYAPPGHDQAILRLSWRFRGEKNEQCRALTKAELDALPAHMRLPRVCTTELVPYRLVLNIDNATDTLMFAPAGAKRDRPIFVLHDVPLSPGWHDLRITFAPLRHDVPVAAYSFHYSGRIEARRGRVTLLTLSADARGFFLVQ